MLLDEEYWLVVDETPGQPWRIVRCLSSASAERMATIFREVTVSLGLEPKVYVRPPKVESIR